MMKGMSQSSTEKRVNLTHHWPMHVVISPWNTIELCRTFRWDVPTTKRQIVTLEVKNLGIIEKKSIILNFDENWWQWWACGCRHLSLQLFSIHPCRTSSRNDFLHHQRKNVPGSQLLSYRFATSEKRMLQVRANIFSILGIAYSVIKWHTFANLVAIIIYNKSTDMWT